MRRIILIGFALLALTAADARAERASVVVVKATVSAAKAAGKAVRPVPAATWHGVKWLAKHI